MNRNKNGGTRAYYLMDIGIILLACLSLALPFASYKYMNVLYSVSGIHFLAGKSIAEHACVVHPSAALYVALLGILTSAVTSFFFSMRKGRYTSTILSIAGVVTVLSMFIFHSSVSDALSGVKSITSASGVFVLMAAGLLSVAKSLLIAFRTKKITALDIMIIPGLLYLLINNYIPMTGILLAFKDINFTLGIFKSPWVGFDNFVYLFKDLYVITRNTILYNIAFIIVGNFFGIMIGVFLAEVNSSKFRRISQSSILLPNLISMVIISYIVYGFLSTSTGWINNTLLSGQNNINFYMTKAYWPFILVLVHTWKGLGYSSIIYLSSIVGIDNNIYEAAVVDGCGKWSQFTKITLPMLKPTITTLVLLSVGRIFFSDFGLFYQIPMNSGILSPVTQTIDTYVYRALTNTSNLSRAAAAGAFQAVVGFITILTFNQIVRKFDRENALF